MEKDVPANPIDLFTWWFSDWKGVGRPDANAMTLVTADPEGKPGARIVLLKDVEDGSFVFFTNYNSKKGRDITVNPNVSLLFYWPEHERQVRIDGVALRLSRDENVAYFNQRPFESRVGAISSPQSEVIPSRESLEQKYQENLKRFENASPECPEHWGGYRVHPEAIEFWQGRANRLHDRLCYSAEGEIWKLERLAP